MINCIKAEGITKVFNTGTAKEVHVLKGINLEAKQGEILGIIGESGAGKSTLLHILGTIEDPTTGTVHYNDINVFQLKSNKLAEFRNRNIGFIFQFHHLLGSFNAIENVAMPALIKGEGKKTAFERAEQMLVQFGLKDRTTHLPSQMSGGEQQRLAALRGVINSPQLLLADEPTGNLDHKNSLELYEFLRNLNSELGQTIIIISHDPGIKDFAHRVVELKDGKIEG